MKEEKGLVNKKTVLGLRTKLTASFVCVVLLAVGLLGFVASNNAEKAVYKEVLENVENVSDLVNAMVNVRQDLLQDKMQGDLNTAQKLLANMGTVTVAHEEMVSVGSYTVPTMYAGNTRLTMDFTLVDEIQQLVGGTATVFYRQDDKLIRVSTNVLTEEGNRGVGTIIDSSSPVYQTIINNETYYGRAWVVNAWYITGYAPITDGNGEIIGVIYVGIREQDPELQAIINDINMGNQGYVYVFDSNGDLILHPTMQGENIGDLNFVQEMTAQKNGNISYNFQDVEYVASYRYFSPWDWHIVAAATDMELKSASRDLTSLILKVSIVIGLVAAASGLLLAGSIVKPIYKLKEYFEIASKGDLTVVSDVESQDELGILSNAFNTMINANKSLVGDISNAIEQMSSATEQVNKAVEESNSSMTEIASSVDRVAWGAQENANALRETNRGADEVATTAQNVFEKSQIASEHSKKAMDEVKNTIGVIDGVTTTVKFLDEGRVEIGQVVGELVASTEAIANFVSNITGIAEQTNLLALNAAIESARAGEHGKGFAVVAEEVRKLAEESSKSAKEIATLIEDIQTKTETAVAASEKTGEVIVDTVTQVEKIKTSINHIVAVINQANAEIQEIKVVSEEQSALSEELTASVADVSRITEESAASAEEIAAGVEEQASSLEEIGATMQELDSMANELLEKVRVFKV